MTGYAWLGIAPRDARGGRRGAVGVRAVVRGRRSPPPQPYPRVPTMVVMRAWRGAMSMMASETGTNT